MQLDEARVREAERLYGAPREARRRQELQAWELDLIERECGDRRSHDVTVFIVGGEGLALVHKPSDPPGAFWAPAGGVAEGESLADAVRREAWEETGLEVQPLRYLLRLDVIFAQGPRSRPWTSHVFLAGHVFGEPHPEDTREIEWAEWVSPGRFRDDVVPVLRASGWGRYEYRLWMADLVIRESGLAGF